MKGSRAYTVHASAPTEHSRPLYLEKGTGMGILLDDEIVVDIQLLASTLPTTTTPTCSHTLAVDMYPPSRYMVSPITEHRRHVSAPKRGASLPRRPTAIFGFEHNDTQASDTTS